MSRWSFGPCNPPSSSAPENGLQPRTGRRANGTIITEHPWERKAAGHQRVLPVGPWVPFEGVINTKGLRGSPAFVGAQGCRFPGPHFVEGLVGFRI